MGRGAGERDDSKKRDSTMAKEHSCLIIEYNKRYNAAAYCHL